MRSLFGGLAQMQKVSSPLTDKSIYLHRTIWADAIQGPSVAAREAAKAASSAEHVADHQHAEMHVQTQSACTHLKGEGHPHITPVRPCQLLPSLGSS